MQLALAPGAITFSVHISPHVSKVEPEYDHPMHKPKLAFAKELGISSSSHQSIYAPSTDSSHWEAICYEFPNIFELALGLPTERDIDH